jgi:hypothetical protein
MKRTIILAAALQASIAGAAYKCVDEKGITHFGTRPPRRVPRSSCTK